MASEFTAGQKVKVVRAIDSLGIEAGEIVEILVVVSTGQDWKGPCSGVILNHRMADRRTYPYVWDFNRFAAIEGT